MLPFESIKIRNKDAEIKDIQCYDKARYNVHLLDLDSNSNHRKKILKHFPGGQNTNSKVRSAHKNCLLNIS